MKTIGIRVAPSAVTYAIYDDDGAEIVSVDKIVVPKSLSTPEALKYIRYTVLDIIREYGVEKAGIRLAEGNAKSVNIERIQIESVIQEALASSPVESFYCGRIASISARLNIPREDFKKYLRIRKIIT